MKTKFQKGLICLILTLSVTYCGPRAPSSTFETGSDQEGYASWYGGKFHGRKTASGEVYDQDLMTAAHKKASFGTLVRVTNLDNGKNTIVKINDRGPFVKGRIIDLSREAAKRIDMLKKGTARVKLDFLAKVPVAQGTYMIQTGSYSDQENAQMQQRDLRAAFPNLKIQIVENKGFFRVHAGPYPTRERAGTDLSRIKKGNFDGIILQF